MSDIHISISAETVFYLGDIPITNSIITSWIVSVFIIAIAFWAHNNVKYTKKPKGLQNFLELFVETLHNLTYSITESTIKTKYIFPFVISFFSFIILNNWFGLIPGVGTIGFQAPTEASHATQTIQPVAINQAYAASDATPEKPATTFVPYFRAGTADLNTTLALALISCVSTWVLGIKFLGLHYFARFKNPLELISEFSRLISFTFRLFGNIFAGEVLLVVMVALVPIIVPSIFYGLEIFVGLIQAFVFSILTLVFMNLATESHGGSDHKAHA